MPFICGALAASVDAVKMPFASIALLVPFRAVGAPLLFGASPKLVADFTKHGLSRDENALFSGRCRGLRKEAILMITKYALHEHELARDGTIKLLC